MPSLFRNAVASIRMGVEDFRQQDHDRDISAVRNFYAGVLLLAKEALIRAAPDADPDLVIGARIKPVSDGNGGIEMRQVGHTTIDFQQIGERARDFGVPLDHGALNALNRIRNDMEHHYTSESSTAIRAVISKAFPVAAALFRHLGEDPVAELGEAWTVMLDTKDVYDQELRESRATLAKVEWYSSTIADAVFRCDSCKSELVGQIDSENVSQDHVELRCRTCGASPELSDMIESLLDDLYRMDSYIRFKEAGEDGPLYQCPACGRVTLVEGEESCANCGESLDYNSESSRCGETISIQDYIDGLDGGLCSYCQYASDKVMRDD